MSCNQILKYFPNLDNNQMEKINNLQSIYEYWNSNINLISRKDFQFFYERHVLHSLAIVNVIKFKKETNVMDLGTGGGFPGVPLAIFFPKTHFFLVDSIQKKTNCLKQIVNKLELNNVQVINSRAESVNKSFDFIVCRAVAPVSKLYKWGLGKISTENNNKLKNGLICLKGGDLEKELKLFQKTVNLYNISDFFIEDFFNTKKILHIPF